MIIWILLLECGAHRNHSPESKYLQIDPHGSASPGTQVTEQVIAPSVRPQLVAEVGGGPAHGDHSPRDIEVRPVNTFFAPKTGKLEAPAARPNPVPGKPEFARFQADQKDIRKQSVVKRAATDTQHPSEEDTQAHFSQDATTSQHIPAREKSGTRVPGAQEPSTEKLATFHTQAHGAQPHRPHRVHEHSDDSEVAHKSSQHLLTRETVVGEDSSSEDTGLRSIHVFAIIFAVVGLLIALLFYNFATMSCLAKILQPAPTVLEPVPAAVRSASVHTRSSSDQD